MAKRVAVSKLNATTVDILNTIRANASPEYQSLVPEIESAKEIPRVGEALFGYPSLANQFLTSLINRIASVRIKSATFNNAYAELKKGYLEFGETVEEVFVGIAKAREFNPEKAEQRELKRSIPDVRTAFHVMNWRVQYPITIQDADLRQAFLSAEGVQDMIARIVDAVYTANEYDEYLLFKYLLIKAISHGKMFPVGIGNGDMKQAAVKFRGMSNKVTFMSPNYNASGVTTTTPKADQYIFMDSMYNAEYDVNVLASAFNMDKADFMGRLMLVDEWDSFDNERFETIRQNSDMVEEVTNEELAMMANVKAVLVDREWFQVYDNELRFTEKYVASGMYWNYFLNSWKTISSSPFSNAIVFVVDGANTATPATFTVEITGKDIAENATVFTIEAQSDNPVLTGGNVQFVQNQQATENGVAIHKYGAVIIPGGVDVELTLTAVLNGDKYTATSTISTANNVGSTITFNKG